MSAADEIAIVNSDGETDYSYVAHGQSKLADRVLRSSHSNSSRSLKRRDFSPSTSNMASSSNGSLSSKQTTSKRGSMALFDDQDVSLLDPRRFTPTLHASLVSEILSLRRELESRSRVIEDLETTLDDTRDTTDSLSESLANATRENRTLKRQMSLIEGGTFSAVEELTRERDDILENANDLRKRLEQAHQKIKSQEEDHDKTQKFWEQDQMKWQSERRELETKIHITEGRLKNVLQEIMMHQPANNQSRPTSSNSDATVIPDNRTITGSRTPSVKSGRTSPIGLRRASVDSDDRRTVRFSMDSINAKVNDMNLADELAFDDEDSFYNDRPDSHSFSYEGRPISIMSSKRGSLHWNALRCSMDMNRRMGSPDLLERLQNINTIVDAEINTSTPTTNLEYRDAAVQFTPAPSPGASVSNGKVDWDEPPKPMFTYRDAGVQFTPPPSPPPSAIGEHPEDQIIIEEKQSQYKDSGVQHEPIPEENLNTSIGKQEEQPQINQVEEVEERPAICNEPVTTLPAPQPTDLISSSCQTTDDLLEDLLRSREELRQSEEKKQPVSHTESAAVQTDEISPDEKYLPFAGKGYDRMSCEIPVIAIHPPASNPPTPRSSVVLPPHTKNASCQVDRSELETTQSIATQTEEIRIDQRRVKLPQGLLPSPIPYFPNENLMPSGSTSPTPFPPPKSPRRKLFQLIRRGDSSCNSTAPGSPKSSDECDGSPRACKVVHEDGSFALEKDSQTDYVQTKTEHGTSIPILPYHKAHQLEQLDEEDNEEDEVLSRASFVSEMPTGTLRRTLTLARSSKKPMRPSSTTSSSSQTMDADTTTQVPYPVPVRHSSRNRAINSNAATRDDLVDPPLYLSAEDTPGWAVSSKRQGTAEDSAVRSYDGTRTPVARAKLKEPMKRVRANAVPKATKTPSMRTVSPAVERSPTPPSLLDNSLASPPILKNKQSKGHLQSSRTDSNHHQTSVVDAIAQTMVGEWMWKYVRRRRSFTVSENRDNSGKLGEEGGSGARHKRWVWLAPYERAVMWSSKQPTSGTALLGKSGRKLTVQSVLDVKDDNSLPKGANPENHFNRSIVILTPERALKFTALTPERHHIWLTALSFLSHPAVGMNDLAAIPPIPQDELKSAPTPALRRNPIRDSIRVAKGKRSGRFGKFSGRTKNEDAHEDVGSLTAIEDAASPPSIPRFSKHNRKRSITGPKLPVHMLRSFSSNALSAQGSSMSAASPTVPSSFASRPASPVETTETEGALVKSITSNYESKGPFFDTFGNGTVRMEAFVDNRPSTSDERSQSRRSDRRKLDMVVWTTKADFQFPDDGDIIKDSDTGVP
ncbi:hypothetical protein KEM56_006954 [Ascosphaera pollenicola]|nr:hypothetical protein KEM56_006954 [Ascosphaera pollenicola]